MAISPLREATVFTAITVIPLGIQSILLVVSYVFRFQHALHNGNSALSPRRRVRAVVRRQIFFGLSAVLAELALVILLSTVRSGPLQQLAWVLAILISTIFQLPFLPEEAVSAAGEFRGEADLDQFWRNNERIFWMSSFVLVTYGLVAVATVSIRVALPTAWPSAWAMWMMLGCTINIVQPLRYKKLFPKEEGRRHDYFLLVALCVVSACLSWSRDWAGARLALTGVNHLILTMHRGCTLIELDRKLRDH